MQFELQYEAIEFSAVLKQRTGIALALEQPRLVANGAEERRLAGSDQATMADIFASKRHKRAGFDIALGVYVK
jgi:hypothetical protein